MTTGFQSRLDKGRGSHHHLKEIIELQFSAFGRGPWFINGTHGACFIKKSYEEHPFVKRYFRSWCPLVGTYYAFSFDGSWKLFDFESYEGPEMTDDEFRDAYNSRDPNKLAPADDPPRPGVIRYQWALRIREEKPTR